MKTEFSAIGAGGSGPGSELVLNDGRWQGALEGMHTQAVYGWAIDRNRPDARVVIEICLDDLPCACVTADVARGDLLEHFAALDSNADICHGFVADVSMLSAAAGGVLSARIANSDITLPGNIALGTSKTPPPSALNSVFGDGGLRLHGWAMDPSDPQRTQTIRAFVDQRLVAQTVANLQHPSMRAYVEGAYCFELALPSTLADGRVHSVRVVDDKGLPLNGSPLTVCCSLDGMAALLPGDADQLVLAVADYYERHLPRSLPMNAWPQWSTRFEAEPPAVAASLTTAVLVTESATPGALERTVASIRQQEGVAVRVFSGAPFAAMLADALASDADVICCMRAGDTLAPHGLALALEGFTSPDTKIVYTDSEQDGRPWFKPAWNPDYALASDYPLDWLLVRSTIARDLPAAMDQAGFAWSALSAAALDGMRSIIHVPHVLYHVRTPLTPAERDGRLAAACRSVQAIAPGCTVEPIEPPLPGITQAARRIRPALPDGGRKLTVSLIIPTRDRADLLKRCIDSLHRFTSWPNLELIVIDNGSLEPATTDYFAKITAQGVRVLSMPGPFNYADLNNRAIAQARGDIVGLINNDVEALHEGWLDEIVAHLLRPGIGAVGAKLLWPNGMVQHGGVLLGVGNVAGHFGNFLADGDWGDHGRNQLPMQVSACTAACLFLRRQEYLALGGMDRQAFPVAFNDVDLCLRIRASGKSIVWTPFAKLLHAESASRGNEDTPQKQARAKREIIELRRRWGNLLLEDPAYHPSLNLDPNSHAFGGMATPPRSRKPRAGTLTTDRHMTQPPI